MNVRLLSKLLGVLSMLIGGFMLFSLPWAFPHIGRRTGLMAHDEFEASGFWALLISTVVCLVVGGLLYWVGRRERGRLFRKEAMAVVGLGWILATVLGALPYRLSETHRGPAVRVFGPEDPPQVINSAIQFFTTWHDVPRLDEASYHIVRALCDAPNGARGLSEHQLIVESGQTDAVQIFARLRTQPEWSGLLIAPGEDPRLVPADRASNFRIRWVPMTLIDCCFESQSGFSTTGASVISDLEDPYLVPYCILFWRSSTHFLGGMGIIVLFVVILGQGSAGKALMRAEVPGPAQHGATARVQHSAWMFAGIYASLNAVLALILLMLGMSPFDAICHSFGTMATGGFSTWNASVGHFDSPAIDYVITAFMILAGTNFTLLYFLILRQPGKLLSDIEWRTYLGIMVVVTALMVLFGMIVGYPGFSGFANSFRYALFQVVSILTTTGYVTQDFDQWGYFAKAALLILMFIGGCSGSTGGGMKVIRHIVFGKIMWLETERTFHPRIVRVLRVGGESVDDTELRRAILVYFGMILTLFVFGSMFVVTFEPDSSWGSSQHKLIDSSSSVVATLNNIGPGLGAVGASNNYGHFSGMTKVLFVWLMMLGRLEVFPILVLFAPRFWRSQ